MPRSRVRSLARKTLPPLLVIAVAGAAIGVTSPPAAANTAPVITSTDFPDGDAISPMVGEIGELMIDSPDDDVVSYQVYIADGFSEFVKPTAPDEPVMVSYMPKSLGRHLMTVSASHEGGTGSSSTYSFRVSAKGPVSSYDLADASGSDEVSDGAGTNTGIPGRGVEFGTPGPKGTTAAAFDGSRRAYVSTRARGQIPTDEGFAAAAWVKIDDLQRDQTIVSVNGCGEAGFVLGYHSTSDTSGTWTFEASGADGEAAGSSRVTGGTVTEINHEQWVHVAGVYNDHDQSMQLYLNGQLVGTEIRDGSWRATKTIQIGRSLDSGRYRHHLDGSLAEIRLFDRAAFAGEDDLLDSIDSRRAAYWRLNADGSEHTGKSPLLLNDGASIYTEAGPVDPAPLTGDGHLTLDGETGYAHTDADLVDTRLSFSVTTRVRLTRPIPDRDMTVFALPGKNTDLVEVKYATEIDSWRLVVAKADNATAEVITVDHPIQPTTDNQGQGLSVTYDAFTGQVLLWVNGEVSETPAESFTTSWSTTGIQIGRSIVSGSHFFGAVDDVRVYAGACDSDLIARLASRTEFPNL